MRQVFFFILSVVYLFASAGVAVNLSYCCGQLDHISFFEQAKGQDCEGSGGKDCCGSKSILLKVKVEQTKAITPLFSFEPPFLLNTLPVHDPFKCAYLSKILTPCFDKTTIYGASPPAYILHATYRL